MILQHWFGRLRTVKMLSWFRLLNFPGPEATKLRRTVTLGKFQEFKSFLIQKMKKREMGWIGVAENIKKCCYFLPQQHSEPILFIQVPAVNKLTVCTNKKLMNVQRLGGFSVIRIILFFKWANNRLFSFIFVLFKYSFTEKIDFSGTQTRIITVRGEHADHLIHLMVA